MRAAQLVLPLLIASTIALTPPVDRPRHLAAAGAVQHPQGAQPLLEPYVQSGSKFFVVAHATRGPLRVACASSSEFVEQLEQSRARAASSIDRRFTVATES